MNTYIYIYILCSEGLRIVDGIISSTGEELYQLGILDVATDYSLKKTAEHLALSLIFENVSAFCFDLFKN